MKQNIRCTQTLRRACCICILCWPSSTLMPRSFNSNMLECSGWVQAVSPRFLKLCWDGIISAIFVLFDEIGIDVKKMDIAYDNAYEMGVNNCVPSETADWTTKQLSTCTSSNWQIVFTIYWTPTCRSIICCLLIRVFSVFIATATSSANACDKVRKPRLTWTLCSSSTFLNER